MKILRVIWSMDPAGGGPSQGIRNSIPELTKLGVQNEVVSLDSVDSSFLGKDPFVIHPVGKGKGPWSYNSNLIPWLLANFNRFDIVIIHGLWQYPSFAVHNALVKFKKHNKGNGPRLYVMPHGMLDPWFQRAKSRKLKAVRNWLFWKLVEGRVINNADGLLFTCEAELKLARETFRPYNPNKEINVGYGIQTPPSFSQEMSDAFFSKVPEVLNRKYLLFLSRINYKKGVDLLIEAYSIVLRESSEIGREIPALVIAGPELEADFGKKMTAMVADDNLLRKNIVFPGMLSGLSKWGAFYGCEGFILPSHQENFGIAVAEALACGKPVMISNQVNIWTEIKEANAGIVDEDNLDGVLKMLRSWFRLTEADQKIMGNNGIKVFREKFEITSAASQFLKGVSE
jgi:glycosyltransferase involved in cell wall biosynthesis